MVYADEVVAPGDISEIAEIEGVEVSDKELTMARQLIASLSEESFEPDKFEDTYRNQVMDLIEAKASGKTEIIAPPAALAEDKVVDLMAALEASVKEAKQARQRHPAATSGGEMGRAPGRERGLTYV